jgi:RES domain-containing protein
MPAAWRLTRRPWADLSGEGARLNGGRWNSPGRPVVYLSEEAALPPLEVLVHLDLPPDLLPPDYVLMRVDLSPLVWAAPDGWIESGPAEVLDERDSRGWGDRWIAEGRSPVLRVPSILVAESANLVVNVRHPLAASIPEPTRRDFAFDPRLL